MAPEDAPRLASTVMLLREGPPSAGGEAALEVFVLHRVAGMVFAPSVTVFPGGGVDCSDSRQIAWSGPDRHWWASALGTGPAEAGALVVAAVRELFEETGVLLADGPATDIDRQAVAEHRRTLAEVLAARNLTLRSELLRPWANWVTPKGNTRRYDTFFFLARQPEGQSAKMLTSEAESGRWARPADLLAEYEAGQLAVMAPTLAMLRDLNGARSVAEVMGQRREIVAVRPVIGSGPGEPPQVQVQVQVQGRILAVRRDGDR